MTHPDFEYERRVAFSDTDMAGIAHFTSVLRWVEEAEAAYRRERGGSLCVIEPDGTLVGWPKVAVNIGYVSPVLFDEVLVISLGVARDGKTSRTWRFAIRKKETGLETARGEFTVVHIARAPDGTVTKRPVV